MLCERFGSTVDVGNHFSVRIQSVETAAFAIVPRKVRHATLVCASSVSNSATKSPTGSPHG
jgi:hypothetical protein